MRSIEWRQSGLALRSKDLVVWVGAKAAEASWSIDMGYYLAPGGAYRRRDYLRFGKSLDRRKRRVDMVEADILEGRLIITSGDYVFRWMLDHGASAIPLSMEWPSANRATSMLGAASRVCQINQRSQPTFFRASDAC